NALGCGYGPVHSRKVKGFCFGGSLWFRRWGVEETASTYACGKCVELGLDVGRESEVLNDFPRFVGILVTEFAAGGAINFTLKMKGDMIIEDMD
ncbi:hypothetical protein Tco_0334925, partial [Tanacetum coccineum]